MKPAKTENQLSLRTSKRWVSVKLLSKTLGSLPLVDTSQRLVTMTS